MELCKSCVDLFWGFLIARGTYYGFSSRKDAVSYISSNFKAFQNSLITRMGDSNLTLQTYICYVIVSIPSFGVATRVRRNCSTSETFEKRSVKYQSFLISRGCNPSQVKQQFEKVKSIPRENRLVPNTKQSKKVFPLLLDYNPSLPGNGKILHSSTIHHL